MKHENVQTHSEIVNVIEQLKETANYYLTRYRFDPFMVDEHKEQIAKLDKLLTELKEKK